MFDDGQSGEQDFDALICDTPEARHPPAANRYVLYVAAGCPFSARAWMVHGFYGLDRAIEIVKVFPAQGNDGWFWSPRSAEEKGAVLSQPDATYDKADPVHGFHHLSQLYQQARPGFAGHVTVPLLWDRHQDTIVSNRSLDLARMLATQFRPFRSRHQADELFPLDNHSSEEMVAHDELVDRVDQLTERPYQIHRCKSQSEYEGLLSAYFGKLDEYEEAMQTAAFLMGDEPRFADLALFATLVRLDLVYGPVFRMGRRTIRHDYPCLWRLLQRVYALPGIADTVIVRDIKCTYYLSAPLKSMAGPTVPLPPDDFNLALEVKSANGGGGASLFTILKAVLAGMLLAFFIDHRSWLLARAKGGAEL